MKDKRNRPSLFFPLLIIMIGFILLLKTFSFLDDESVHNLLLYWPVLLVIGGIDGIYQSNGYVGPTLSIGVGIIFLLGNLGYYDINIWSLILKYWPVLIIAAGFDLLFARRSFIFAIFGIIVGIGLLGGMVWLSGDVNRLDKRINNEIVQIENRNATFADITLLPKTSDLKVVPGEASTMLLEADIELSNHETIEKQIDYSNNHVLLESTSSNYSYPFPISSMNSAWNIKINNRFPINLQTDLVIGEQHLDLCELRIGELNAKTIIGKNTIYLPCEDSISADVELIVGELVIYIPENAGVEIEVDSGLTFVNLPNEYTKSGRSIKSKSNTNSSQFINLKINQPVGILTIKVY